jgi:ABC-type protease/lipase transport system fused ATPase/permease subunit
MNIKWKFSPRRSSKCTVVLVAHRLSTVINADVIGVVHNGVIAEVGNHASLSTLPNGLYAKLVSRQVKRSNNTLSEGKEGGKTIVDAIDDLLKG